MCTDLRDFRYATLQVNSNHTDIFTRLRIHVYALPGHVILTSVKSWRSPTILNI